MGNLHSVSFQGKFAVDSVFSMSFLTQRAELDIFLNSSSYLSWLVLLETAWIEHSFSRENVLFCFVFFPAVCEAKQEIRYTHKLYTCFHFKLEI